MSEPKSYGPIGQVQGCLCCQQASTAAHVDTPSGADRWVASAVASCLSTIEAVEREGLQGVLGSLCGPCREAFQHVVRSIRS